jgi:Serine incorporator (Serinc)
MLALCIFFLMMALISLAKNAVSDAFNRRLWLVKILVILLLICLASTAGQRTVKLYYYVSAAVSPVAILWLIVCVIDLFYKIADCMATRYFDMGSRVVAVAMILITSLGIFGTVLQLTHLYGEAERKSLVYLYMVILVASLVTTLLKFYHKSNVITFAMVSFMNTSLLRLSVESQESTTSHSWGKTFQVAFFTCLMLAGVLFISLIDEANEDCVDDLIQAPNRSWEAAPTIDTTLPDPTKVTVPSTTSPQDISTALFRRQTLLFHTLMAAVACLSTALVTSWKIDENAGIEGLMTIKSVTGMHVQLACAIVGQMLYVWTTVAPKVLTDREFE